MVLLHLLHELAPVHGWQLTVAHLNHRLRGRSSEADECLVCRTARALGLPVRVERADVRKFAAAHHFSLEMAAREVRHEFLARTARQLGIPTVALAHHAEDQLELFFLRLLRGSGGEGLAGMKWRNPSPSDSKIKLVRPLLGQAKSALREFAEEKQIGFREDASNTCLDFLRNRIRHELLPLLRSKYQRALDKTVLRAMDIVQGEAEFVTEAALDWLARLKRAKSGARTTRSRQMKQRRGEETRSKVDSPGQLPASILFDELPVAVQRRCIQLQLLRQGIVPNYDLIEQLRPAAGRPITANRAEAGEIGAPEDDTPSGAHQRYAAVRDEMGRIHLQAHEHQPFNADSIQVDLSDRAGEIEFAGAKLHWRIDSKKTPGQPPARVGREYFDADRVGSRIGLRYWRPGDHFQPIGMAHPLKLQDFFVNQKVPRNQRRGLIVATTADGEIFWVERMRISERFKLTRQTIRRLQWRWKRR